MRQAGIKILAPVTLGDLGFGNGLMALAMNDNALALICTPTTKTSHHVDKVTHRYKACRIGDTELDLALATFKLIEKELGISFQPQAFEVQIKVPVRRGLGEGSCLIVAAALAANALLVHPLSTQMIAELLCSKLEWLNDNKSEKIRVLATLQGGIQWLVDPNKGLSQRLYYPNGLYFSVWTAASKITIGDYLNQKTTFAIGCLFYGLLQTKLEQVRIAFSAIFQINSEVLDPQNEVDYLGGGWNNQEQNVAFIIWSKSYPSERHISAIHSDDWYYKTLQIVPTGSILL